MKSKVAIEVSVSKNRTLRGLSDFLKRNPKLIVPVSYLLILILGVFLMEIAKIFPGFKYQGCVNLGGQDVCTLLGIYVATVVSLPGYIILGALFRYLGLNLPELESYIMLLVVNVLVYYIVGLVTIRLISIRKNSDKFITYIIVSLFTILLVTFLLLKTV